MSLGEVLNLTRERDIIHQEYVHLYENYAFLYVALFIMVFMSLGVTSLTFPLEAKIFRKEYRNGWYSCISYFLGRSLAEVPFQVLFVSLYVTGSYFLTGQIWSLTRISGMVAIVVLVNLVAQTQGLISGAIFMDHVIAAVFVAAVATVPFALFNSFFVRLTSMSDFVKPIAYLSYFYYAFNGLVAIVYGFGRCVCTFDQDGPVEQQDWAEYLERVFTTYLQINGIDGESLGMNTTDLEADDISPIERVLDSVAFTGLHWTSNCSDYRPVPMAEFQVTDTTFYNSIAILIIYIIATRLITYCILVLKVDNKE